MTNPASLLVRLVKEAMLLMEPSQRLTARECLDRKVYSPLWSWSSKWEVGDDDVPAANFTQELQNQSFGANSLQSSRFTDTDDMTFETVSGFKDREQNEEATQNDAGLLNDPHPMTFADGNFNESVEAELSQPHPKNSTADSRPQYGSDDSAIATPLPLLRMLQVKRKISRLDWKVDNGDTNIAFSLVAKNERAKQMWADAHNSSRYIPPSFSRMKAGELSNGTTIPTMQDLEKDNEHSRPRQDLKSKDEEPRHKQNLENDNAEPRPKHNAENNNEEPRPDENFENTTESKDRSKTSRTTSKSQDPNKRKILSQRSNFSSTDCQKNCAKGFIIGSDTEVCGVLLGAPGDCISRQMLAFIFNEGHRALMEVSADKITSVKFNSQEEAERNEFTWILPRGQKVIHVDVAEVFEFDVVFPDYGRNEETFHQNCDLFLSLITCDDLPPNSLGTNAVAATKQSSDTRP